MSGAQIAGYPWKYSGQALSQVYETTFIQYRPANTAPPDLVPPLDQTAQINATLAGFVSTLTNANRHATAGAPVTWDSPDPSKPRMAGFFDPAVLAEGDYLVGPFTQGQENQTFYVSQNAAPSPPVIVRCNAVLDFARGIVPVTFGAQAPLDDQAGTEVAMAAAWPGSVLREGRGQEGDTKLPGDVKLGGYLVLLPPNLPFAPRSGDILSITTWLSQAIVPEGTRLIVVMSEGTLDGWKLLCTEAST
jgi:hypothetical protein